jgi:hypothetical protein
LRAGRLSAIELATVSAGCGHEWTLTRRKLRKFWKGRKSLADQVRQIVTSQPQ